MLGFSMAPKGELVGLEFGGNKLKIAYVKSRPANKKEVIKLLNRDITGFSDQEITKLIRSSFLELEANAPEIIDIIPSNLVITRNIEIPSIDPREIKEIINLQAGRHTPYAREEIIVDYIDIGTYKNSYTKVLLVIIGRNVIKRQYEIIERAGLKLAGVLLAPEGLGLSVSKLLRQETQDSPVSIVHIDEGNTDFAIVFRGRIIFVRPIPIGAQHLIFEKEKYVTRFADEIKRSLEAYQNEDIEKSPASMLLTGATEELKDLENDLNAVLHLPARISPYLSYLTVSDLSLKTASLAKHISFLNVIAPLIFREEMKVDLVPEEIKLRRSLEERGKDLIKTGVLILAVFVLVFSTLASKIYFKGIYLSGLNKRYEALNEEARELEKDFSTVSLVKDYLSRRGYPLEILTELHSLAPLELQLSDIRVDEQGKVTLKGTAESMATVFSFVDNLSKTKFLREVKTKYTTKRKAKNKDVTDFEIGALLSKEGSQ
ncbi:MAG: pilus assembly protein PilM [Candidatus Omnitrophica bacterium]|nr:pilus assembly protein PilM [Candidatus Omnitrophota bacterium]